MARRNDIDWERVQKLYVAGQLTIREIAAECGIAAYSITQKANKLGWQRNLAEAIKERTKAKIAQIDVNELVEQSALQSAQQSAQTIQQAIEDAANISANVRLRQRSELRVESERAEYMQELLVKHLDSIEGVGDVAKATMAFKNLMDVKMKIQDREDKIFGLDGDADHDGDEETVIIVNGVKVDG